MPDKTDRKTFLVDGARKVIIGGLLGSAAALFAKAVAKGGDCIGDGKCRVCLAFKKCELPLASDERTRKPPVTNKTKGSLSQKRDMVRKHMEQHHG
jgi:hypothetical protein